MEGKWQRQELQAVNISAVKLATIIPATTPWPYTIHNTPYHTSIVYNTLVYSIIVHGQQDQPDVN